MNQPRLGKPKGFISVFVLVAMVGAVLIAMASLMRVASQSRQTANSVSQPQVDLLFEAALDLAKSRLAAQPQYDGETWQLDKADSRLRQPANVVINVEANTDPKLRDLEVIVNLGEDPSATIRDRRTWTISLPATEQSK
ncbi:hypothetical protein C5Y96_08910 [Blastopirellula marina]|uniref:General secretion pathway protein GspI n=1 Tax=Blastopirellula marina TaxID=124 RepID=A0A2S8FUA8_9BACT|nr:MULTISPECIES: hypothetical protein [Pirellulaceae]PQO35762.1 hypothetical protein C5Y96_08910 [Blastopirellula marina]RCS53336.1 hypothetical protein DTL36_08920 [Bremerella cremea]